MHKQLKQKLLTLKRKTKKPLSAREGLYNKNIFAIPNFAYFVYFKIDFKGNYVSFLLDPGADISTIRNSLVAQDQAVNTKYILSKSGVTKGKAMSLDTVEQDIFIEKYYLLHEFQVVEDDFPIPTAGLLGKDFFLDFKSIIEFEVKMEACLLTTSKHFPINSLKTTLTAINQSS
jgi:hypothetical protein